MSLWKARAAPKEQGREQERAQAVLEANARDLLRYLERRLGSEEGADALSETMLIVWRRAQEMPADDHQARLWCFGVARNVTLNLARSGRRRSLLARRLLESVAPGHQEDHSEGVAIREVVAALEPDQQEIVRAVHWEGFSLSEVSTILGLPASTVRSRYAAAKRELAKNLQSCPDYVS